MIKKFLEDCVIIPRQSSNSDLGSTNHKRRRQEDMVLVGVRGRLEGQAHSVQEEQGAVGGRIREHREKGGVQALSQPWEVKTGGQRRGRGVLQEMRRS